MRSVRNIRKSAAGGRTPHCGRSISECEGDLIPTHRKLRNRSATGVVHFILPDGAIVSEAGDSFPLVTLDLASWKAASGRLSLTDHLGQVSNALKDTALTDIIASSEDDQPLCEFDPIGVLDSGNALKTYREIGHSVSRLTGSFPEAIAVINPVMFTRAALGGNDGGYGSRWARWRRADAVGRVVPRRSMGNRIRSISLWARRANRVASSISAALLVATSVFEPGVVHWLMVSSSGFVKYPRSQAASPRFRASISSLSS